MKTNFTWDGEKIKQTIAADEQKHTPKDIINGLDHIRAEIKKNEDSVAGAEETLRNAKANIQKAKKDEKQIIGFEDKCIEIQENKLGMLIKKVHQECYDKAKKDADEVISQDPEAYSDYQKKQLPYLNYQKLLATNEKISEKIARRVITKCLYTNPIFENPFKD